MNLLRLGRAGVCGLRFMSESGPVRTESSVAAPKKSKFALVNGKFRAVRDENLPTLTEEITHTGQYFEENDWRRQRFIDRKKTVNRNWAVDMVEEVPPIEIDGRVAFCDGATNEIELGHPRVFINLDKGVPQSCLYCGLRYVKKQH